jgi:hypothetical protein
MHIQILEERVKKLEEKIDKESKHNKTLAKRRARREGAGREGGGLEEEGSHKGHGGLMVQWGRRLLQGCPDLEEVVLQVLSLQALTRCLPFVLYMCN